MDRVRLRWIALLLVTLVAAVPVAFLAGSGQRGELVFSGETPRTSEDLAARAIEHVERSSSSPNGAVRESEASLRDEERADVAEHVSRAAPPSAEEHPIDPCDDEDSRPSQRNRLDEIANARLSELADRARVILRGNEGSPSLRAALEAVFVRGETGLELVDTAARAPDRVVDGFDFAVSLALALAVRGGPSGSAPRREAIDRARRLAPNDAVPHVLDAIDAAHAHDRRRFREALERAFEREPSEPAITLELAHALARTPELDRAIAVLDSFLASEPRDVDALRLRERLRRRRDGVGPSPARLTYRGISLLGPSEVPRATLDETLRDIASALDEAARLLGVPRRDELTVLVHRDHAALVRAMCGQSWTAAAYDGVLHVDRDVVDEATTPRDQRRAILRHESLHAALHDRPRDVPYWADEGIAQHFAGPSDPSLARSYARMVRDRTYVPFASLDGAFLDIDDPEDARLAYHQSHAMIAWLVARRGPRGIAELVARLDAHPRGQPRDPAAILSELAGTRFDGDALLAFLATQPR